MFVVFMSDLILFEIFPHGRGISHTASSPHGSPSHPYSKKNYVSPNWKFKVKQTLQRK